MSTTLPLAEPARSRIVRMTNVKSSCDAASITRFFSECRVLDQFRTTNVRTGTAYIVYVLFSTAAEKIWAVCLSGRMLHGRKVNVQPAPLGNYLRKLRARE
jgi:hypothetical protein